MIYLNTTLNFGKYKKVIILTKALELSLARRAGTKEYAIANSMGYIYQDNGDYTK